MTDSTRTILTIYVVWHPNYSNGSKIAELVRRHFRSERYKNISENVELNVFFRSSPAPNAALPLPIDLDEAETTAVVVLAESELVGDSEWMDYIHDLAERTESIGFGSRLFPVMLEEAGLGIEIDQQALRWDRWEGTDAERGQRLVRELLYAFSRMLRHYLAHLRHPEADGKGLEHYLEKVQIFLSHSKHDSDGERIAKRIRDWLHQHSGLSSFFDMIDIPPGLRFQDVLNHQVKASAVMAVHTDSYSSREWCRHEVIEAKHQNVPMIVVNCMTDIDERGFPYMGNVPIVRMDPNETSRIDVVIGRLLDEVFKDFLWQCRVELAGRSNSGVLFMPRPPELIFLANPAFPSFANPELISASALPADTDVANPMIVYPDPPLGAEEEQLFEKIAPRVRLLNLSQWLTEV